MIWIVCLNVPIQHEKIIVKIMKPILPMTQRDVDFAKCRFFVTRTCIRGAGT